MKPQDLKVNISFIHEDQLFPGQFIIGLSSAVLSLRLLDTDGSKVQILAGNVSVSGYREGLGYEALFNTLAAIVQTDSSFIVTDSKNHCLRELKLDGGQTFRATTYAGECEMSKIPYRGHVRFLYPKGMVKKGDFLFIADSSNQRITRLDITDKTTVKTVHQSSSLRLTQLLAGHVTNEFYVTVNHGVIRVLNQKEVWVVGCARRMFQNQTQQFTGAGFGSPQGMAWLTNTIILVADYEANLIKVVDLELKEVRVICPGKLPAWLSPLAVFCN